MYIKRAIEKTIKKMVNKFPVIVFLGARQVDISPNNPDKNFAVLNKYSNNIATGIVICMTKKLQPINRNCWLCPITLI